MMLISTIKFINFYFRTFSASFQENLHLNEINKMRENKKKHDNQA